MLSVRSQDKKRLIIDGIMYDIDEDGYISSYLNGKNYVVAKYSSDKKALKVLNMLEAFVNKDLRTLYFLEYPAVYIEEDEAGLKTYKLESDTFYFLKDSEVQIYKIP